MTGDFKGFDSVVVIRVPLCWTASRRRNVVVTGGSSGMAVSLVIIDKSRNGRCKRWASLYWLWFRRTGDGGHEEGSRRIRGEVHRGDTNGTAHTVSGGEFPSFCSP